MSNYEDVIYEKVGRTAIITINRPSKYNAFRPRTVVELLDAFQMAGWDRDVGSVVFTGAGGKAFCTGGDQSGDQMIGLLGAAALAIHGGSADRLGQARGQPGDPGDVVGLLPVLRHAATDDLFNGSGVDSRFIDERLLYGAQQFSGVQPGQPTSALSDRAAGGVDDHRIPHGTRLEHVPLL